MAKPLADPIKPTTSDAIRQLHDAGIRIVMFIGDNSATANVVARKLGIDEFEAEVLPDQKRAAIQKFKANGRNVAMAGDGVNDAPALAEAHVGIAMGTGTDVAMGSAGITLVGVDLRGIVGGTTFAQFTPSILRCTSVRFAFEAPKRPPVQRAPRIVCSLVAAPRAIATFGHRRPGVRRRYLSQFLSRRALYSTDDPAEFCLRPRIKESLISI
jgi:hypothetical protein